MEENLSLSSAQIQYLKIGPKVGTSHSTTKHLQESLNRFDIEGGESSNNLASIPKFSYGNFERTVSNFGVLLHRNFVGTTTLHQAQKFGKIALAIDRVMQDENDKVVDPKRAGQKKKLVDPRTALKAIYEHKGYKMLVTLKSFAIESLQTNRIVQTLPLAYLKLITTHVNSQKLVKAIEMAMRSEGSNMVVIDFDKMEGKVSGMQNSEDRYVEGELVFERNGQQFSIILPSVEIYHSESDYKASWHIDNKDILEILDTDFDNVETVVQKYADFEAFERYLEQSQKEESSRPIQNSQERAAASSTERSKQENAQ